MHLRGKRSKVSILYLYTEDIYCQSLAICVSAVPLKDTHLRPLSGTV